MSGQTTDTMLEGISISAEKLAPLLVAVKSDIVRPVAFAFAKNILNVTTLLAMPETAVRNALAGVGLLVALLRPFLEGKIGEIFPELAGDEAGQFDLSKLEKANPESVAQAVMRLFEQQGLKERIDSLIASAPDYLRSLAQHQRIQNWFANQLLFATAGSWTAFECLSADLWVATLNAHPDKLAQRAFERQEKPDPSDGISGKAIQFGLLARYEFDLRSRMGTILKPKFDLTTVSGIAKAYTAAFGDDPAVANSCKVPDLHLLEASRHVIVHRAGVVDDEFHNRTKRMGLDFAVGAPLPLDGKLVSRMVNAAIDAGSGIIVLVDQWLTQETVNSQGQVARPSE